MSDWFYAANNEQKGPVNESELKANFATHKLPADTLVWKDGMDNWTPANQVPAFTFRQPPIPAKVQPPLATAASVAAPGPVAAATPISAPAPALAVNPAPAPVPAAKAAPEINNPSSTTPVDLTTLMGKPEALEVDPDDVEKNRIFGILAYLWILCLVPIIVAKDSPFAKYHANQGLVLFICEIAIWVTIYILSIIIATIVPMLGFLVTILSLVHLGPLVLLVWGIINAAAGKCVPLPIIGGVKLLK